MRNIDTNFNLENYPWYAIPSSIGNDYEGDDEDIKKLLEIPSIQDAGGFLVRGTPWKNESTLTESTDDRIVRVYFSYSDYARFTEKLTEKIQCSGIQYDAVVTMPKGGVAIGTQIAKSLGKPLGYYHANSYSAKDEQGKMQMGSFHRTTDFPKQGRILLVDDLADTGVTFSRVRRELEEMGYIVDTAAIFHKDKPDVQIPTHCLFPKYPPLWIVQPTEGHLEIGSPTENHPIGSIDKDKITRWMRLISTRVQELANKKTNIRIHLPSSVTNVQAMIAIGAARLLGPRYNIEFIPTEGRDEFSHTEYIESLGIAFRTDSRGIQVMPSDLPNLPMMIAEYPRSEYGSGEGHDDRFLDKSGGYILHKTWATRQERLQLMRPVTNHDQAQGNNKIMESIIARG